MKQGTLLTKLESLLRERFSQEYMTLHLEKDTGPAIEVKHRENFGLPKSAHFPIMAAHIILGEPPTLNLIGCLGAAPATTELKVGMQSVLLAWALKPHGLAKLTLTQEAGIIAFFITVRLPLDSIREEGLQALLESFFKDWKQIEALVGHYVPKSEEALFFSL